MGTKINLKQLRADLGSKASTMKIKISLVFATTDTCFAFIDAATDLPGIEGLAAGGNQAWATAVSGEGYYRLTKAALAADPTVRISVS